MLAGFHLLLLLWLLFLFWNFCFIGFVCFFDGVCFAFFVVVVVVVVLFLKTRRLTLNSCSSCLSLANVGLIVINHHIQSSGLFLQIIGVH